MHRLTLPPLIYYYCYKTYKYSFFITDRVSTFSSVYSLTFNTILLLFQINLYIRSKYLFTVVGTHPFSLETFIFYMQNMNHVTIIIIFDQNCVSYIYEEYLILHRNDVKKITRYMQITDKQAKNILFSFQRDKDYSCLSTRNKFHVKKGKCHLRKMKIVTYFVPQGGQSPD